MKNILTMALIGLNGLAAQPCYLHPVNGFPNGEAGIEQGVSACYAGGVDGLVVMAGGCNFPENTLAPDSRKRFYKGIYVGKAGDTDQIEWTIAGELPQPMAYGVSVTCDNGLIVAGGANTEGSLRDVYRIELVAGKAHVNTLPSLPCEMDNMAGTLVGRRLYVAGGFTDGKASHRVFCLDMDSVAKGWEEIMPFPGIARVQPVAGSMGKGRLCIFGGFAPAEDGRQAELAMDGCVYDEATGEWTMLDGPADEHGEALFVGGGIAINIGEDSLLVIGGVNKEVFLNALNHPQPDYLTHPAAWYRFNPYTLLYSNGCWKTMVKSQATARAGAALAQTSHGIYLIGGELKPRVRANRIYRLGGRQHLPNPPEERKEM